MRARKLRPLLLACLVAACASLASLPLASSGAAVGSGGVAVGVVGNPQAFCATAHAAADRASCNVLATTTGGDVVHVRAWGMSNVHVFVLDEARHEPLASFDCRSPVCIVPLWGVASTRALRLVVTADAAVAGAASTTSVEAWIP